MTRAEYLCKLLGRPGDGRGAVPNQNKSAHALPKSFELCVTLHPRPVPSYASALRLCGFGLIKVQQLKMNRSGQGPYMLLATLVGMTAALVVGFNAPPLWVSPGRSEAVASHHPLCLKQIMSLIRSRSSKFKKHLMKDVTLCTFGAFCKFGRRRDLVESSWLLSRYALVHSVQKL